MLLARRSKRKGGSHAEGKVREARRRGRLRRSPLLKARATDSGGRRCQTAGPFLFPDLRGRRADLRAFFRGAGLLALAALAAAASGAWVPEASSHGGPPLRIGVTESPPMQAAARLVLSHLRDGVGFAAEWRRYPDYGELRAALAGGKVDIAVGLVLGARAAGAGPTGPCGPPAGWLPAAREELRQRLGAEFFPFAGGLAGPDGQAGEADCLHVGVAVARGVLEDLRFTILGREVERVLGVLAAEDVEAVRAAQARGGDREAAAAARAVLAGKRLR